MGYRAIGMLQGGVQQLEIARLFNCSRQTVANLARRFRQTGDVVDLPRSGRPRVTTRRQDVYIRVQHTRNRFLAATRTAQTTIGRHNRAISGKTVRRRLKEVGLKARRPYKGAILTARHRQERLQWARAHRRWIRRQWSTVLFSDESKFNVSNADGRKLVYRRRGERYADCCVLEHNGWGEGSVMVWAGISAEHKTPLHTVIGRLNAVTYRDTILRPIAVPFLRRNALNLFQHDNARPHSARVTTQYLRDNNVNVLPWPSLSQT